MESNDATSLRLGLTCGLLASAARLVPVPFLDDLLREKALQILVSRTLQAQGRSYPSKEVAPLYGDPTGCLQGCFVGAFTVLLKLALFPIKKFLIWVMAAKWLARDLSEALLLGRVLERVLGSGQLSAEAEIGPRREEATRIRRAFDNALAGTDMVLLRGTLVGAARSVSGLPRAAMAAVRKLRGRSEDSSADPTDGLNVRQQATMDEGTKKLTAALESDDMVAFLAAFDARFDENLAILEKRGRE